MIKFYLIKKVDWVQQVFQQSFDHLDHLETFEISISNIMQWFFVSNLRKRQLDCSLRSLYLGKLKFQSSLWRISSRYNPYHFISPYHRLHASPLYGSVVMSNHVVNLSVDHCVPLLHSAVNIFPREGCGAPFQCIYDTVSSAALMHDTPVHFTAPLLSAQMHFTAELHAALWQSEHFLQTWRFSLSFRFFF